MKTSGEPNFFGVGRAASGQEEVVLIDVDGPGAIVRLWSATPFGTVRIFIDHAVKPVVEASMADLLGGRIAPFLAPFAGLTAKGGNVEFPFPFREHLRVTWEGGRAGFYQITYRKYQRQDLDVVSFGPGEVDAEVLASVARALQFPTVAGQAIVAEEGRLDALTPEVVIPAGPGGEEIVSLALRPSPTDARALREAILSMRFDGQETVRAPLGEFFGAGPGLLPHKTLPLETTADGAFVTRFVMPFGREAVLRIDGSPALAAEFTVLHRPAPFDGESQYFHAHWISRGPMSSRPYRDILVADVTGEGAYVGTMLAVGNSSTDWWGEGDDKVWVDGELFPSQFGTGTEDYFGQGYCSPEVYDHAYRAQSLAAGGFGAARGLFSMVRAHVLDPIRFAKSLQFNLELWHWDDAAQVTVDTVSYFYLGPLGANNLPPATAADFRLSPLGP